MAIKTYSQSYCLEDLSDLLIREMNEVMLRRPFYELQVMIALH